MAVVDELVAVLGFQIQGQDKLRQFNQSIETAARRLTMFAAAAATAAAGAATLLGKSVLQTGMQFEKLNLQLEILEGSAEKAGERMEWLREFAVNTPLDLQQATDAFVRMRNFGLDPLDGSMQAIVDANALMGGSAERLNGIILALGQAWTKQKFQAEEANQLLERGIPAWELMSEATGMTTAKLMELSEKGKIGRKEIKLLIEQMGIRASGASARFAKTMEGQIGKLQDLFMTFKKRIADAGFYDAVKLQLNRLFDYISRLDADGTLQRWAEGLSWSFTKASNFIADFVERAGRHFLTIARIINENRDAWDWLKWVLLAIGARLFPMTIAFGALALAIEDVLQWMGDGKSVIGDFVAAMEDFLGLDRGQLNAIAGTLLGLSGLAVAAAGIGLFTLSLSPLTRALLAFAAAFAGAKAGFEFLQGLKTNLDNKIAGTKAVDNPKSKPGYIESAGYDSEGKFIYMNGAARVDKPTVNTTEGFTQDALDLKFMLQNAEENLAKMNAGQAGKAVENTINDSSDKSVNVTINQTVQQATDAPAAAASATANAAAGAASRSLPPPRFIPGGV